MGIRLKGWTAHPAVKVISFLLIPVFVLTWLWNIYILYVQEDLGLHMLFGTFESDSSFYQEEYTSAISAAEVLLELRSEERNLSGEDLAWRDNGFAQGQTLYSRATGEEYATLTLLESTSGSKREAEQEVIQSQLGNFRWAMRQLEQQRGLLYRIDLGEEVYTNTTNMDAGFYLQQSVFYVLERGEVQQSRYKHARWDSYGQQRYGGDEDAIYLSFTESYYREKMDAWLGETQHILMRFAVWSAVQVVGAVICFLILLCGSGRRRFDGGKGVHYTVLDKPFLDLSFWALFLAEGLLAMSVLELSRYYVDLYSDNYWGIGLVLFLLGIGMVLALGWFLSFVKRMKDHSWWKHTLIYTVLRGVALWCGSLWAGVPLTAKVVAGVAVLVLSVVLCVAAPPLILLLAAVVLVAALRYARRLYLIAEGARLAGEGVYDPPISVQRGELGKIADSINRMSQGVNAAIAEQLKSERMKTELITNVSHDIRTPLTSLITYTDLLKSEGLDNEKAPEYLEVLIQKSQRLKHLVDELFEAAKAASGSIEVQLGSVDLSALLRQCLGELDEQVQSSGLDFRVSIPESALAWADGRLMWRVVENLFSNVFKYAMAGSRVYILIEDEGKEYRLEMKNISASPLNINPAELTERFKRGDESRTNEGSGLGLSIVQSFVQVQGGRFVLLIDGDLFKAQVWMPKAGYLPVTPAAPVEPPFPMEDEWGLSGEENPQLEEPVQVPEADIAEEAAGVEPSVEEQAVNTEHTQEEAEVTPESTQE